MANLPIVFVSIFFFLSFFFACCASFKRYGRVLPKFSFHEFATLSYSSGKKQTIFSVIGTTLGGAVTVGFIGLVYKSGTVFYLAGLAFLFGLAILLALIPRIREIAHKSQSDSIEAYISGNEPYLKGIVSCWNIFTYLGLFIAQLIVLKQLSYIITPEYGRELFYISLGSIAIYTALFGLLGVQANDIIQTFFIFLWIGATCAFLYLNKEHVVMIVSLDKEYLNGLKLGYLVVFAIFLIFPWTTLARAEHWQRIVAAKRDCYAQNAYSFLTGSLLLLYTLFCLAGLTLLVMYPSVGHEQAPLMILETLPELLKLAALVGIFAALVSSADSFLNVTAISVVNLIPSRWPRLRDLSYPVCVVVLSFVAIIAIDYRSSLSLWVILSTSSAAILVPAFVGKTFSFSESQKPSVVSIVAGILVYVASILYFPSQIEQVSAYAALVSAAAYLFVWIGQNELNRKYNSGRSQVSETK